MDEKSFWAEIYCLLSNNWPAELEPLGFCDWIEVSRYKSGQYRLQVEGKIGLIGGSAGEIRFILTLVGNPKDLSDVRWHKSLPGAESKGWISFDVPTNTVELDPKRANK